MRDLATFQRQLAEKAEKTELALDRILIGEAAAASFADGKFTADDYDRLITAMRYCVLGGGKRIRPFLVMATAELFGGSAADAETAGCAIELIHCYSLVHDDLPSMDDDDLRRGKPTLHKAFDEATAILAGDALLTLAFEIIADDVAAGHKLSSAPATRLALVRELAKASGFHGMVHGQMLDLAAEGRFGAGASAVPKGEWTPRRMETQAIEILQRKKTGALIRCAVRMGALIGGASDAQLSALTDYAEHLGLAFQIADDLIDAEGDAAIAGKATAKDADRGKATLVSLHGIDFTKNWLLQTIRQAENCLESFGPAAEPLRDMVHFMGTRNF